MKSYLEFINEGIKVKGQNERYVKIYRVGNISQSDANKFGLWFSFDLDYYKHSDTAYKAEDAKEYLLDTNSKIWDPCNIIKLDVNTWSRIDGLSKDFEKYGIKDECDWEMPDKYASTSTDGLAQVGKHLGYKATIIRDVPSDAGYGKNFDEICVYDLSIIKDI